jgi:hypothetical protein
MEPVDTPRELTLTDSQIALPPLCSPTKSQFPSKANAGKNSPESYCAEQQGSFMRDQAFIDRTPQLEKLRLDIETCTANAEQHGVGLQDIVLQLLQRAEDLCLLGNERGLDLTRVGQFFAGDGE